MMAAAVSSRISDVVKTSSVAAGFNRHGMPPPASNDTGTALAKTAQTDHVTLRP